MVEQSGGGVCRCACPGAGEEFDLPPDDLARSSAGGCCSAQVFTSVLLGILSCVLMTGGVFLAFHRWDPLWLLVSGIGALLILIGTLLHCCSAAERRRGPGKGCCGRPPPPTEHPHHAVNHHNGSLTEQLLPLSNARSVSQLSLNMLPGYFPPVVTAYGIEQHSAVVQNINRLVQQQQSQVPGNPTGKSFLLLSLPGENGAGAANLQNLLLCQLDGSVATEVPGGEANGPAVPALVKNAEVQTCNAWPSVAQPRAGGEPSDASEPPPAEPPPSQTESSPVDLMDCSADAATHCDMDSDIPPPPRPDPPAEDPPAVLVDIPEPPPSAALVDLHEVLVDIPRSPGPGPSEAETLIDIACEAGDVEGGADPELPPAPAESPDGSSSRSSSLSALDDILDEGEFYEPPPSYDDVAHEGDNPVGTFGLAYGTI